MSDDVVDDDKSKTPPLYPPFTGVPGILVVGIFIEKFLRWIFSFACAVAPLSAVFYFRPCVARRGAVRAGVGPARICRHRAVGCHR